MAWTRFVIFAWGLVGCGDRFIPDEVPHQSGFLLECGHDVNCNSCHNSAIPPGPMEDDCLSCHRTDWPDSHDREVTTQCQECHETCDWKSIASPHPAGFAEPEQHGMAVKLQDQTEGRCQDCHGEDLSGGTNEAGVSAQGCDDCHAQNDHPNWRTECTFCHGGENDTTGAPPVDIDGESASISFSPHHAHVDAADGDYRALPCTECHTNPTDALSPGHLFEDDTPEVGEVVFTRGIAEATAWDGNGGCANNYCHGNGSRDDGTISASQGPLGCEDCHATENNWSSMSGLHESHLESDTDIVCNDCHGAVIDRDGAIVTPPRHVDGARDIAFYEPTLTSTDGGGSCSGPCHGYDHDLVGWGHVPDYELPELHGLDSNIQISDCGACHGEDWTGGIGQGCDDCHADEGFADWRTDCTFCHGGQGGDDQGMPPQDIDSETDPEAISFTAHSAHIIGGVNGHRPLECASCHLVPEDALTAGHALDLTPEHAEVDLVESLSWEGGYDQASRSCSNMYCHGNGRLPSGTVADGDGPLSCDSCHATTSNLANLSGTHATHIEEGVICEECHAPVVDASNTITEPDLHVNRVADFDEASTGYNIGTATCTITCHNTNHQAFNWAGPHPAGYDAPEMHGQEALLQTLICEDCHGADLDGGSAQSCETCHDAGWRSDCTWCHGNTDASGVPPEDIDNTSNEDQISFKAHPEHVDGNIHPLWGCETCHGNASGSYSDAFTDPNHWLDSTRGVAEVSFTGLAAGTSYASGNCSNSYCHGNGIVDGSSTDSATAKTCDGCHSYAQNRGDLSGTHATHLGVSGVTCADCHDPIVNASGGITDPDRHVDGTIDIDASGIGYNAVSATCTITCHNEAHTAWAWTGGHPPGYDAPEEHGQDALFQASDCKSCHGTTFTGGTSGQGCDSCHDAGWKSDCTFCHGNTDPSGVPPQDLDNTAIESQITFMSHPQHVDGDDHPEYGCEECHGTASASYSNALTDVNHWYDTTIGVAEVDFDGLAAGGTYTATTGSCGSNYCHGNGNGDDGTVVDSNSGLACSGCHDSPPSSGRGGTGEHRQHDHDEDGCEVCHNTVAASSTSIDGPDLHVNGTTQTSFTGPAASMTFNAGTNRCTGSCHGEGHSNEEWD